MIIPAHPSPPFVLPREIHAWTVGRAKAMVDNLKRHQYDIVGDLDDLISDDLAREGIAHDEVSDADLLDLAVPVLAKTLMQQKRLRDDIRSLRRSDRGRRSQQLRSVARTQTACRGEEGRSTESPPPSRRELVA